MDKSNPCLENETRRYPPDAYFVAAVVEGAWRYPAKCMHGENPDVALTAFPGVCGYRFCSFGSAAGESGFRNTSVKLIGSLYSWCSTLHHVFEMCSGRSSKCSTASPGFTPDLSVLRAMPYLKGKSSHKLLSEFQGREGDMRIYEPID